MEVNYRGTEKQRAYNREYQKKWRSAHKERNAITVKKYQLKKRTELLNLLGGTMCVNCGFTDIRALQIDHINGGGNKERKEKDGTGSAFQFRLHREAKVDLQSVRRKYQVLCANCNWIKKYEKKENYV